MLKPRVAKHQPNLCENQHQPTWKMGWPHVQNSLSWVGLEGTFSASKPPKTQRKGSDGKCRSCPILQKCTKYIIYIYTHRNLYIYYTYIYIIHIYIYYIHICHIYHKWMTYPIFKKPTCAIQGARSPSPMTASNATAAPRLPQCLGPQRWRDHGHQNGDGLMVDLLVLPMFTYV